MNQTEWIERKLSKDLMEAGMKVNEKEYLSNAFKFSLIAAIFFWLAWNLLFNELFFGIAATALFFLASVLVWIYLPEAKKRKRAALIERDLPFALMQMSVELNVNVPFEKSLERLSKGGYGLVSGELGKAIGEVKEKGASLQEAFIHASERNHSHMFRRALAHLTQVYEQGNRIKGEGLRSLAREELARQRAKSKEFSGKLVTYSLMFIALSAIIPALFQAFIVVGSTFMELTLSPLQVLLIPALVFPLIDLAVLQLIRSKNPEFLKG